MRLALVCLIFAAIFGCSGRTQQPLYPKHIETPEFPVIARTAHVTGKIWLTVTVDADGKVTNVEAQAEDPSEQRYPVLQNPAIENMKRWTFIKPSPGHFQQVILYDYEFDPSLPGQGGPKSLPPITKVSFDLPDRVSIWANVPYVTDVSPEPKRGKR